MLDNSQDMVRRGRALRGMRNPCSRLDDTKVREIRRQLENGESQRLIAQDYGVGQQSISHIAQRRTWDHVQ